MSLTYYALQRGVEISEINIIKDLARHTIMSQIITLFHYV